MNLKNAVGPEERAVDQLVELDRERSIVQHIRRFRRDGLRASLTEPEGR